MVSHFEINIVRLSEELIYHCIVKKKKKKKIERLGKRYDRKCL
jgi:hypothetical protein